MPAQPPPGVRFKSGCKQLDLFDMLKPKPQGHANRLEFFLGRETASSSCCSQFAPPTADCPRPARSIGATGCTSAAFSPNAAPRPRRQQDTKRYFGVRAHTHTHIPLHLRHCPVTHPGDPTKGTPQGSLRHPPPAALVAAPHRPHRGAAMAAPHGRERLGSRVVLGCQPTGVPSTRWGHREPTPAEGPQGAGG